MSIERSPNSDIHQSILATGKQLPLHIVDMHALTAQAMKAVFTLAEYFKKTEPYELSNLFKGKVIATLFYQPSTRTRLNFESAAQRLGLGVVGFCDPATTRAGDCYQESIEDVVRFTSELTDLIVLRHYETGVAAAVSRISPVPLISAGDGYGQHPTQALGDIWTMIQCLGDLTQRSIGLIGDVNIRSLKAISLGLASLGVGEIVYLLPAGKSLPIEVIQYLENKEICYRFTQHIDYLLEEVDLVETIGLHHPNHATARDVQTPSTIDHARYSITRQKLNDVRRRPLPILLHPGPRGAELSVDVDSHPSAYYFTQARNGLWIRMALMAALLLRSLGKNNVSCA